MEDTSKKDYSVHVHFHGTPTPEFMEVFNRMLELAAKEFGDKILNEDTEKGKSKLDFNKEGFTLPDISIDDLGFGP